MDKLVVFVHGLGVDEDKFWGSTPVALKTHRSLKNYDVHFWGYQTTKGPVLPFRRLLIKFGIGQKTQTLELLGQHLWSDLRQWVNNKQYSDIKLLGHSMGGLVVASAVGYGLQQQEERDANLIEALRGIAFVATPLGGANLVEITKPIFQLVGENVHVRDLAEDSKSRKSLVARFIDRTLKKNKLPLQIFRASNDAVVDPQELTSPLPDDTHELDVLRGGHSDCIQHLKANHDNFHKLVTWITNPSTVKLQPDIVQEATEKEITSPVPQAISAPDGSYVIKRPPDGWTVHKMNIDDWVRESFGIKDHEIKEGSQRPVEQTPDILVFDRGKQTSIIPIPGKTILDGRRLPSALEISIPTQLAIVPIERAHPPLFVERPLEHNFLIYIGQISSYGTFTARESKFGHIVSTGRRYMEVEFRQELQNATVNGREGQDVNVIFRIIGIEGELVDHLLLIKYSTVLRDPEVESDPQILQTLINSFQPLGIINPEKERGRIEIKANEKFKALLSENGEKIFNTELRILFLRLKNVNLDDPEVLFRTMKSLKPFQILAQKINLQDKELDAFWKSLHQAETGDTGDFKAKCNEILKAITTETESNSA